jgi:uncharacterized protein YjbI with pentapeptide repeats
MIHPTWLRDSKDWIGKHWVLITAIALLSSGLVVFKSVLWPEGTGFGESQSVTIKKGEDTQGQETIETSTTTHGGKTLWDWLSLLGVPVSLAFLGFWMQNSQQNRIEEKTKEEVLQVYFDRISVLLLDEKVWENSTKKNECLESGVNIIRARTFSILRRFNGDVVRKTEVIRFLVNTELINRLALSLSGANLSGADLFGACLNKVILNGADLRATDLRAADLVEAKLITANLARAKLNKAHLCGADLIKAHLCGADLSGADLSGADLSGANLSGAVLSGADLSGANLSGAVLSGAEISSTRFISATLISADLSNSDLRDADFSKADLTLADLSGANLTSTNLSGTTLSGAVLKGSNLRNADLADIVFNETRWPSKEMIGQARNIPVKLKKEFQI